MPVFGVNVPVFTWRFRNDVLPYIIRTNWARHEHERMPMRDRYGFSGFYVSDLLSLYVLQYRCTFSQCFQQHPQQPTRGSCTLHPERPQRVGVLQGYCNGLLVGVTGFILRQKIVLGLIFALYCVLCRCPEWHPMINYALQTRRNLQSQLIPYVFCVWYQWLSVVFQSQQGSMVVHCLCIGTKQEHCCTVYSSLASIKFSPHSFKVQHYVQ